jgi:polyhydroxyalkanoate synthesis regulator phasin
MAQKPFVVRGMAIGAGYYWSMLKRKPRAVPDEMVKFLRREQMQRLKNKLTRRARPESQAVPVPGASV